MSRRFTTFRTESVAIDYSVFAPRLYNLCKKYGLRRGHIRLATAFCSDRNQGYPLLLLSKHFGTFPVEVGTASGGIDYREISEEQDGDLVIIQASHMGCSSLTKDHDIRQKPEWMGQDKSRICRYQDKTLRWYLREYQFSRNSVSLRKEDDHYLLVISNKLLDVRRTDGLFLNMDKMVQRDVAGNYTVAKQYNSAKAFVASEDLVCRVTKNRTQEDGEIPIGEHLDSDLFYFKRNFADIAEQEWYRCHELNIRMPKIITSQNPVHAFVKTNIQIEFDHNLMIIVEQNKYRHKNLIYIAGVHQDVVGATGLAFPPTQFIPWAALIQHNNGTRIILKQEKLKELLSRCSFSNKEEINLEDVLHKMEHYPPLRVVNTDTSGN